MTRGIEHEEESEMATTKTILVDCFKCDGKGTIEGFGHIANGVCFRCMGAKKLRVKDEPRKSAPLDPVSAKMIEYIKTGDMSKLNYGQLNKLRDFAHWSNPHEPRLLEIWRERGDEFFFASQAERLEQWERTRQYA